MSSLFSYERESTWMTTTLPSNCAFPPSLPAASPSGKYNVVGFFHEKLIISPSPSSWKVYTASSEFVMFQTLYAQPMTSPVINDNVYGIIQSGWPRTASSSGGETQPFVPWSIFHQFRKLTKSHLVDQIRLRQNKNTITVKQSWQNPTLFTKTKTIYKYRYKYS